MALSGLQSGNDGGMFSAFSQAGLPDDPAAEEMERQREAALFNKTVKLKNFSVETYDLSKPAKKKAYASKMQELYHGTKAQTHVILCHDRRFVDTTEPRWMIHLEWAEFDLSITANPSIGVDDG